jgi:hypothetical protein
VPGVRLVTVFDGKNAGLAAPLTVFTDAELLGWPLAHKLNALAAANPAYELG